MTGAGEYRQHVTLEKPSETTDDETGERLTSRWKHVDKVWAKLKTLNSRELMRARSVQLDTTHVLTIRYRPDVEEKWRVSWTDPRGKHIGNITGVVETVRRQELELSVTETR